MERRFIDLRYALGLVGLALLCATSCFTPDAADSTRGERKPPRLVSETSAGIFVGISEFTRDLTLPDVDFAVDDAVDLAYAFSLEIGLLPPKRVLLLLAGTPQKSESRARLEKMRAAGVQIDEASKKNIERMTKQQARKVGADGILVLSFATHGFLEGNVHYLMATESSINNLHETGVRTLRLLNSAKAGRKSFRLVFVDACRAVPNGAQNRGAMIDLSEVYSSGQGQVIFSAAQPGGFAYNDKIRKNGVFTAAVLDGLRCQDHEGTGVITPANLFPVINQRVDDWTQRNYPGSDPSGSIFTTAGDGLTIPLNRCDVPTPPSSPPPPVSVEPPGPSSPVSMPEIRTPSAGTRLGEGAEDSFCLSNRYCTRIRVQGTVPRNYRAYLAVAPVNAAPRIWIQQLPIVSPTGTFNGVVQLGEDDLGAGEWFSIFVLAHPEAGRFSTGETMTSLPADCLISEPVDVYRAR